MIICEKCFAEYSEDKTYCPECGAPAKSSRPDNLLMEGSDREVYPELSRANALRMRGKWEEAEATCIGILRRFPNNSTAHALLGDICSDQQRIDDAIQWYQMALDLNPNGIAEKSKLERLTKRKEEQEIHNAKETVTAQIAENGEIPIPDNKTYTKVILGLVGLIIFIGVIIYIVISNRSTITPAQNTAKITVTNKPNEQLPTMPQAVPGNTPPRVNQNQTAPTQQTNSGSAPNMASQAENNIYRRIQFYDPVLATQITSLFVDNRQELRLYVTLKANSGMLSRDTIFNQAYTSSRSIFSSVQDINYLTIRILAPPSNENQSDIVFMGDCERGVLMSMDSNQVSIEKTQLLFRNIYPTNF